MTNHRLLQTCVVLGTALAILCPNLMAQGKIVFTFGNTANELWTMNVDGTNVRRILTMPSYIDKPRWSPDGSRIAFVSPGDTEIAVINGDGSGFQRIAGTVGTFSGLTWDPSGSGLIYASACTCCEYLRAVNLDGTDNRHFFTPPDGVVLFPDARPKDTQPSALVGYFRYGCFNLPYLPPEPHSTDITREGGAGFFTVPLSPSTNRLQGARWSPDGNKLIGEIHLPATDEWGLEVLDPFNPPAPRTRLLVGPHFISSFDFGCTSDTVFFTTTDDGARNIYRVRTDGSQLTQITSFAEDQIGGDSLDVFCTANPIPTDFFLHGSGGTANPPTLFLDSLPPGSTTAKYRDSAGIKFGGGNLWAEVGAWTADPALTRGTLGSLNDLHGWVGLKNSDDQGTRFDLRAEVLKNGTLVASGETYCIEGVTRNPDLAREAIAVFGPFSPAAFNGTTDVLSLRILTRIGTNGSGGFCGGHSNAVGLRLYFDAVSRPSRFGGTF